MDALEEIINKSGCRVEIVKRVGFPFILSKLKYRKAFVVGLVVFMCLIIFLSRVLWDIEIIGTEQIPKDDIIELLNKNDIRIGKFKHQIDTDEVSRLIHKNYDYLSFLDIRINGVKLIVELKEIDIEPERVDTSYPCNIIVAENGNAVVEKGQIVEEDDLLISGVVNSEISNDTYLVHANGKVLAETRYSHILEVPIVKIDKVETGNIFNQWGISINDKGIRFLSGDVPYENYIEEIVEKSILNIEWFPFKIVNYIYREVKIEEIKI